MATVSETRAATPTAAAASWIPADPGPLGLAGFGITTFMLSMMNANLVSFDKNLPVVLGMAFAYGGLAQLLAGMWEFRRGNTFGAVAFTSFGAFWISFYFLVQQQLPALAKGADVGNALGLYLWAWAIFTTYMFFCSFARSRAVSLVFLLLAITFILLGIGNSGSRPDDHPLGRLRGAGDRGGGALHLVRRGDVQRIRTLGAPCRSAGTAHGSDPVTRFDRREGPVGRRALTAVKM